MNGTLTKRRKIGYASGIISESVLYNMFYTYFLFFLTDIAGISPVIAGTVSMISIIADGITDPMIGFIADSKKMDKRKLMRAAIIPMSILFVFVFYKFDLPAGWSVAYFIAVAICFWVAYTVYTIPYYALCAELTADYDERTKIRGTSSFINAFAIFVGSAAPTVLVEVFEDASFTTAQSWSLSAFAVALIAIAFGYVAYHSTKKIKLIHSDKNDDKNVFTTYFEVIKLKPFKYLLIFVVLFMLQSSLAQADLIFLLKYRIGVDPDKFMAVALGTIVVGMLIFVPITTKLATVRDRRFAVVVLLTIATLGMFAFKFIGITSIVKFVFMLLFYSIGLAVFWTTFYSFTYDIAEIDEMVNSKKRVGAITSLPQLLQKFGAALGMQSLGMILQFSGYSKDAEVQSLSALMGIENVVTIFCPIAMTFAVIFMVLYPVTKKKYQKLQVALKAKKAGEKFDVSGLENIL